MGLGEKKQAVIRYNSQGLSLAAALPIVGISKSQYYYRAKQGKRGIKPSVKTIRQSGTQQKSVMNKQVIQHIEALQKDPDLGYGYRTMSRALQQSGYQINHKKVYRLMRENALLGAKHKSQDKNYVKYRKVQPMQPLEVLEMDIKMVWVEREKRQAFILNIIDTFSRKWLYQCVCFSITAPRVKQAWEYIILNYLQPKNCLGRDINIEIRNDNDKRFSAKIIQDFFKENHLNQVFTHPYTPQENGHVESFHNILSRHLKRFHFWSLGELEQDLIIFQEKYNNQRLHGSLAHLSPNDFEILWNLQHIQMSSNIKKRKIVFKLKIPRYEINQHTGNNEPEGSSLLDLKPLDEAKIETKQMISAETSDNLRFKKSPSVVPCSTKINTKMSTFENSNC